MIAHVIEGGKVVNTIEVVSLDFMPNLVDASLGGKIGDLWDGSTFSDPPAAMPSIEEYEHAVQTLLDEKAASYGYGDERSSPILSARSYAGYTNPFQAEALALANWAAACWAKCYEVLNAVQSGARMQPTMAQLLSELPEYQP